VLVLPKGRVHALLQRWNDLLLDHSEFGTVALGFGTHLPRNNEAREHRVRDPTAHCPNADRITVRAVPGTLVHTQPAEDD
jgi:hypothetical protein